MQQTYRPEQRHPWPFLSTLGRNALAPTPPCEQPADPRTARVPKAEAAAPALAQPVVAGPMQ